MNSIIEYKGIAKDLPMKINGYKQFEINKNIIIETNRFGAKDLIKVVADGYITNRRIIKTAEGISIEGEVLTGFKYLLKGAIDLKIYYEEESASGLLGVKNTNLKFYVGIALDKSIVSSSSLISNVYIEDIYSEMLNEREILIGITALAVVEEDSEDE